MDWKISLDRYLTTEPHYEFDSYCEDVFAEQFSSEFYNENDEWIEGKKNSFLFAILDNKIHKCKCVNNLKEL